MEAFFPGRLAELRRLGRSLPFRGNTTEGIEAFNDPDVLTFDEQTKMWGFYEVKREEEIRRKQIHTNQAASLGFLKDYFGSSADVAFVILVEEGRSCPTPDRDLLCYDFELP